MAISKGGSDSAADRHETEKIDHGHPGDAFRDAVKATYGSKDAVEKTSPQRERLDERPTPAARAEGNITSGLQLAEPERGTTSTFTVRPDKSLTFVTKTGDDVTETSFDKNGNPSKYKKNDVPISKENWPADVRDQTAKVQPGLVVDHDKNQVVEKGIGAVTITSPSRQLVLDLDGSGQLGTKQDVDMAKNTATVSSFENIDGTRREVSRKIIDPSREHHENETDKFGVEGNLIGKEVSVRLKGGLGSTQVYDGLFRNDGQLVLSEQKLQADGYASTLGLNSFGTTSRMDDLNTREHTTRYEQGGYADELRDSKHGMQYSVESSDWDASVKGSKLFLSGPNFTYSRESDKSGATTARMFVHGQEVKPEEQMARLEALTGFKTEPTSDGGKKESFSLGGTSFVLDYDNGGDFRGRTIETEAGVKSVLKREEQQTTIHRTQQDGLRENFMKLGTQGVGSSEYREWPTTGGVNQVDFFSDSKGADPLLFMQTPEDVYRKAQNAIER